MSLVRYVFKLRFRISMSLDRYTAGPGQRRKHPLGIGDLHGLRLVRTVAAPTVTHLNFVRS